ncbi:flavodoxin domain-containing protein [Thermococcus aggregans]|uniref:Flavodoxin domain-containing protein n=1 Tax=Thermococcus aggregans TaxID=110163 RepID=A0A9E7SN67_THEAG|nr:flavodoxin domain-containing protein [Thermococcus aggregans]USS40150.1 flavodoxin domain-containing protein [Thermococcus aggregans]
MKVCIVYDSKHGTTEKVAEAIREAIEKYASVEVKRASNVETLKDCELIIIGTPIYYERPLKSVLEFLEKHSAELEDKKTAVFIVCFAVAFGSLVRWHIQNHYIKPLVEKIPGEIIGTLVLKGGIGSVSEGEIEKAKRWAIKLLDF